MTRQKAINQLKSLKEHCKEMSGYADHCVWEKCIEALDFAIDSLRAGARPSKKGKWVRKTIRNNKGGCIGAEMICTCCNKDNECDKKLNYCPNCGAKMESEGK